MGKEDFFGGGGLRVVLRTARMMMMMMRKRGRILKIKARKTVVKAVKVNHKHNSSSFQMKTYGVTFPCS